MPWFTSGVVEARTIFSLFLRAAKKRRKRMSGNSRLSEKHGACGDEQSECPQKIEVEPGVP
jgi:hypothetical protein